MKLYYPQAYSGVMDFPQIDHTVLIDKVLPVYNEHKLPTAKAFKTDFQDVPKGVPYAG